MNDGCGRDALKRSPLPTIIGLAICVLLRNSAWLIAYSKDHLRNDR